MRIKKINAVLSLLTVLAIIVHIGYNIFAYLTFYYNPMLKGLTAGPFMLLACLHAILGMMIVFLQADGTRLDLYPKQNRSTVIQRVSAALIFPLMILHTKTFSLLQSCAGSGKWVPFVLLIITQPLFYGTVLTHVAVSVTRALVTLGRIDSREKQKKIDCIVYIFCAVLFALAVFAVIRGQLAMFLPAGGNE